jgi:hypothetical protein
MPPRPPLPTVKVDTTTLDGEDPAMYQYEHLLFMNHEELDRLAHAEARELELKRVLHDAKLEAGVRARAAAAEAGNAPVSGRVRALAHRLVGPIAVRVGLAD